MSEHLLLAPLLESYFRRRLTKQRNATPATVASYRDALRMLILFAATRLRKKPAALALEELDRDLILAFLDELEEKRNNTIATRNARLAAIRSFFHHAAAADPASFGVAQRVLTIPIKRAHIEVTHHLTEAEVDALIAAPNPRTSRGRRDRTFLLFLARTGARVSEATGVNANDLQLERVAPASAAARQRPQRPRHPHPSGSGESTDSLVGRARNREPRAAADIHWRPQRAPDALRSNPYRAACGDPSRNHQADLGPKAHIAAHLPTLTGHEASPVGR